MISLEGHVICEGILPAFLTGLATLFAMYYVFNLQYQEEASCTLEFIQRSDILCLISVFLFFCMLHFLNQSECHQLIAILHCCVSRCFIGINPERGSKTSRGKVVSKKTGRTVNKKSLTVNPRVSTLLKNLMDFQWDFI